MDHAFTVPIRKRPAKEPVEEEDKDAQEKERPWRPVPRFPKWIANTSNPQAQGPSRRERKNMF